MHLFFHPLRRLVRMRFGGGTLQPWTSGQESPQAGLLTLLLRYRYWLISLVTALIVLLPNVTPLVQAQSAYPPFLDPHVNDYGQILEPGDAASLRASLSEFQAQTGVQVVVMTINSVRDYRTGDQTIESFATHLFNTWGIGDRTRNDGILIVVAPGDRQVRIELGKGYSDAYDPIAQAVINNSMLPHFREGRFSYGTVEGARAVISQFNPNASPSGGIEAPIMGLLDALNQLRHERPMGALGVAVGLVVALAMGLPLINLWRRYRKRRCPKCQASMVRLSEREEDPYLSSGQRKEESLRSVDYDVWRCSNCGHHLTQHYTNYASRLQTCSSCRCKTMEVRTRTTRHPSYSCEGTEQVTESCRNCNHRYTYSRSLPVLTRTDNSSSSSSDSHGGGGSSSGGGATGSW